MKQPRDDAAACESIGWPGERALGFGKFWNHFLTGISGDVHGVVSVDSNMQTVIIYTCLCLWYM